MSSGHHHQNNDQPKWYRVTLAIVLAVIAVGMLYLAIRAQYTH